MVNNPLDLYAYAERRNIDVDWVPMRRATSLSVPLGDGYAIALDPWKLGTLAQETVCLATSLATVRPAVFTTAMPSWTCASSTKTGPTSGPSAGWCRKRRWTPPWRTAATRSRPWRTASA